MMPAPTGTPRNRWKGEDAASSSDDGNSSFVHAQEESTNSVGSKAKSGKQKSAINTIFSPNRIIRPQRQKSSGSKKDDNVVNVDDDEDNNNNINNTQPAMSNVPVSPLKRSASDSQEIHEQSPSSASSNLAGVVTNKLKKCDGKKIVSTCMLSVIAFLIFDTLFSDPEHRIFKPDFSEKFLEWVQEHPAKGIIWILILLSVAVIFMIPIGTPITVGCGYIYKGAYGWKVGVTMATIISMAGSALGAIICFLLGRYLMRDQVRKWIRKYPLFDAIDVAAAEHGLRIMAMLYLTPILPLGPVSYMCGTTSMKLSSFIIAKIAALPLMSLYVFIGASTGALIGKDSSKTADEVRHIEENKTLIVAGIILSFVMIACITHYIKKELNTILERQQKHKPGESEGSGDESGKGEDDIAGTIEMGTTITAPRQRKHGQ